MKICYFIQTHKNPEQIYRLVKIIKQSSPSSYIIISHNFKSCDLDTALFKAFPEVEILKKPEGKRGDFSLLQGYLEALDWLFTHNIDFDWLINLSGQDYPTQPLPRIEKFLAEAEYDGFLKHFEVFSEHSYWGIREGRDRYLYQYRWLAEYLPPWQRLLIKPIRLVVNTVQNRVRLSSFYGLLLGVAAQKTPFQNNFLCYGSSYYHMLSRKCVQYLYEFTRQNPNLVDYYKKTIMPDESLFQTVLINQGSFKFYNGNKRYVDFGQSKHGHPRLLTSKDYPALTNDDIHFARKFDSTQDSKILDMLDARILQGEEKTRDEYLSRSTGAIASN